MNTQNLVHIRPLMHYDGKRPIVFPEAKIVTTVLQKPDGTFDTGHTKEELEEYKVLELSKEFLSNFSFIITGKGKTLDLDKEYDRFIYRLLRTSSFITFDKNAIQPSHKFYIENEVKIDDEKASSHRYSTLAGNVVESMTPQEQREFLFLYGENPNNKSNNAVYNLIYERLKKDPEKFMRMYEDKTREYRVILNKLVQYGIVRKKAGTYIYGDYTIGLSESSAIEFMTKSDNVDLYNEFRTQIAEKEKEKVKPEYVAIKGKK